MISSEAAKAHATKLLKYIQEISETSPYSKTQHDLVEISDSCDEVLQLAYQILLRCNPTLLQESSNSYFKLQPFKEMITTSKTASSRTSTRSEKRFEISRFEVVLNDLSKQEFPFEESRECASLLWKWFKLRFLNDKQTSSPFRYNILHIRKWVHSIVIAYSKSVADECKDEFLESFNRWVNSISDPSSEQSKYPLPYSIYQIHKNLSETELTAACLLIWETIWDKGLNKMEPNKFRSIYFNRDDMLCIARDVCPRLAYWHTDYQKIDEDGVRVAKLHLLRGDIL